MDGALFVAFYAGAEFIKSSCFREGMRNEERFGLLRDVALPCSPYNIPFSRASQLCGAQVKALAEKQSLSF